MTVLFRYAYVAYTQNATRPVQSVHNTLPQKVPLELKFAGPALSLVRSNGIQIVQPLPAQSVSTFLW